MYVWTGPFRCGIWVVVREQCQDHDNLSGALHIKSSSPKASSLSLLYAAKSSSFWRVPTSEVLVLAALVFLPPLSAAFSCFIFSLARAVSELEIFLTWSLGRSAASCLANSCRKRV